MPSGHCVTRHPSSLSKGLQNFFQCFTLLWGYSTQQIQKFLLFLFCKFATGFIFYTFFVLHNNFSFLSFSLVSQSSPNLPLIFIIGIPGKSSQFHALHVIQCTAKRLTMDTDLLLGCFGFFGFKASAFLAANLFSVQLRCHKALTGTLVQIGNFFFGLLKGQLDLLLSQGHQILVDSL